MKRNFIISVFLFCFCAGCASVGSDAHRAASSKDENVKDEVTALKSIVGSISGQEVNDKDIRSLGVQLRKDKETQEAVGAISEAIANTDKKIKYCPVTGKRYSPKLTKCPVHDVMLKEVDP
jgi:hypothetical protein